MSTGAIISAPAVILSIMFHWNLTLTILAIGGPTDPLHDARRRPGGHLDRRQADGHRRRRPGLRGGLADVGLPHEVSVGKALHVAGRGGADFNTIDFHFDPRQTYTFWSGLIGGLFLHLSYFGCDQSQVQRYLTAKSLNQARHSLLMSAFVKIPLQVLVLLVGVFMFLYYVFHQPPMLFNTRAYGSRLHRARGRPSITRSKGSSRGVREAAPGRARDGDGVAVRRRRGSRSVPCGDRGWSAIRGRAADWSPP